jgi:hypothetical protein
MEMPSFVVIVVIGANPFVALERSRTGRASGSASTVAHCVHWRELSRVN